MAWSHDDVITYLHEFTAKKIYPVQKNIPPPSHIESVKGNKKVEILLTFSEEVHTGKKRYIFPVHF